MKMCISLGIITVLVLCACLIEQILLQLLIGTGDWWHAGNIAFAMVAGWAGAQVLGETDWDH